MLENFINSESFVSEDMFEVFGVFGRLFTDLVTEARDGTLH